LHIFAAASLLLACGVTPSSPAGPVEVVTPMAPGGPAAVSAPRAPAAAPIPLPNREDSLKFMVLGDFGTGDRSQYQLAEQMAKARARFSFELAVLVGDNLYGSERPQDFQRKFEIPYKPLLDGGVKFYASLGNHDDPIGQSKYPLFNMEGKRYYSFKGPKQSVKFFALESTYMEPEQVAWIKKELEGSREDWKIPYFHHPLYSSGERHGSDLGLREKLEPLFHETNVSVVLTGHDHFYERVKPQNGIVYFVVGSGGKLRAGNLDASSGITAKGFDRDLAFMLVEINKDEMTFNTISRTGEIIDSGVIIRRQPPR
jgi:predicted phosphodiesterase